MMPTIYHNSDAAAVTHGSDDAATTPANTLCAPARIIAGTRGDFRKAALAYIERTAVGGAEAARLDLSETEELDASGRGILVLLQKRAKELKISLELVRVPKDVRHLLAMTKLEHLFRFA